MPSGRLSWRSTESHGVAEADVHNVFAEDCRAHRNGVFCDAQEIQSDFPVARVPSCEYGDDELSNGEICRRFVQVQQYVFIVVHT